VGRVGGTLRLVSVITFSSSLCYGCGFMLDGVLSGESQHSPMIIDDGELGRCLECLAAKK